MATFTTNTVCLNPRETYLITQALVVAMETLASVPEPYTEISNILGMADLLRKPVFAPFATAVMVAMAYDGEPLRFAETLSAYLAEDEAETSE